MYSFNSDGKYNKFNKKKNKNLDRIKSKKLNNIIK